MNKKLNRIIFLVFVALTLSIPKKIQSMEESPEHSKSTTKTSEENRTRITDEDTDDLLESFTPNLNLNASGNEGNVANREQGDESTSSGKEEKVDFTTYDHIPSSSHSGSIFSRPKSQSVTDKKGKKVEFVPSNHISLSFSSSSSSSFSRPKPQSITDKKGKKVEFVPSNHISLSFSSSSSSSSSSKSRPKPQSAPSVNYTVEESKEPSVSSKIDNEEKKEEKLLVALFRGIHYVTNLFDNEEKIAQNIKEATDGADLNKFLVSSAAYKLTGKVFLSDVPGDIELEAGKIICKILTLFKKDDEELYNTFHETYTNSHETFHKSLTTPESDAFNRYREIFEAVIIESQKPLFIKNWEEAVKRNPFVSFSCNARHALRYSFGQKSFEKDLSGGNTQLLPIYDSKGEPDKKHLGKIYIAALSPEFIKKLNPTFILDRYAQNKVDIKSHYGNKILDECEVSFLGYLPENFIIFSDCPETPSCPEMPPNPGEKEFKKLISKHIDSKGEDYEKKATEIIEGKGFSRTYTDMFEEHYTDIDDSSSKILTSHWLHSINQRKPSINAVSSKGKQPATSDSIRLLATNLNRQPTSLDPNWASYLKSIWISGCQLSGSGRAFGEILKSKKVSLIELFLQGCCLTSRDAISIAQSLRENRSLRVLKLDSNPIGDRAARILAGTLDQKSEYTLFGYLTQEGKVTLIPI